MWTAETGGSRRLCLYDLEGTFPLPPPVEMILERFATKRAASCLINFTVQQHTNQNNHL